jgi:tetratricopeptide (TPR) repeat protein
LSAYPEAERHYRLAVEQRGGTLTADASRASILERLGECAMVQGKFEEARHFYEAVLEGGDQQRGIRSEVENRQEAQRQAILWSEIGWTWRHTGDLVQAHSYCTRGEQLLRTADVTTGPALASLRYLYSSLCWQEGRYDEAYVAALEALSLFEQQQEEVPPTLPRSTRIQRTLEGDPVNQGRIYRLLSALAATVGKNAEALDSLNQALAIFEQYDHQREIAVVSANLGDLYLRTANHSLAEAALRRAISLFERMGDRANMSVCLGNLGILAAHCGDLTSAESWYKQGLTLAERVNDPGYVSLWHAYLAATLRDQGRLQEAAGALRHALSTSRATKLAPCIGFSLVTLGSLRIAQASEDIPADVRQRLLGRAKSTLKHALAVEGLEAETGIEAQVMLARVALLQGNLEDAHRLATHALDEARVSESAWLIARASSLRGSILAAQGQYEQAERYFSQALQTFRECGMRLEYARTLFSYGVALHRQRDDQQGLNALQEALQIFRECHANLDLQLAEHPLSGREP